LSVELFEVVELDRLPKPHHSLVELSHFIISRLRRSVSMGIALGKIQASHSTFTESLKRHSRSDDDSLPSATIAKMWAMPKPTVVGESG
jgi:hypothetical protein